MVSLAHLSELVCPLTLTKFLVPAGPCPPPALLASPASPDSCPLCFLPSLPPSCFTDSISVFSTSASWRHGLQTGEQALGSIGSIKKKATQSQEVYSSHQRYICVKRGCSSLVEQLPGNALDLIPKITEKEKKHLLCLSWQTFKKNFLKTAKGITCSKHHMLIVMLSIIPKIWNQSECPSVLKWTMKMRSYWMMAAVEGIISVL